MVSAAGLFARDGDNGRDTGTPRVSGNWTPAGRLLVQPFRSSESVFEDLQAAARLEAVRFSSTGAGPPSTGPRAETILPHRDRAITLGVNWSPNRWIRVQANLIRDTMSIPNGEVPLSGPLVDGPMSLFWSRVVRFRFAL